jgi:hypothetical protein
MRMTLFDIETDVNRLAEIINADTNLLPTYGFSKDYTYPHIEVDRQGMHFVVVERGEELERVTTNDLDTLLYLVFEGVTNSMSSSFELQNRIEEQDCRRMTFSHQEELLGKLNEAWRLKAIKYHQSILTRYPFDDFAGLRATYCGQLRTKGLSEAEIKKLAYAKYPEN